MKSSAKSRSGKNKGLNGLKKPMLFAAAFAVFGASYLVYKSFAAVSEEGCNTQGAIAVQVDYHGAKNLLTNKKVNVALSNFKNPYHQTLSRGSTGPCVVQFQKTVNRIMGENVLKVDGLYKQADENVASHLQNWLQDDNLGIDLTGSRPGSSKISMKVNGKVDPITWAALKRADEIRLIIRENLKYVSWE